MKSFLTRLSKDELVDLLENHLDHPLAISEEDGEFNWCSKDFANRIGYTQDEVILDLNWKDLTVGAEDLVVDELSVDRVKKGNILYYDFFKKYRSKNNNAVPSPIRVRRFPITGSRFKFFTVNIRESVMDEVATLSIRKYESLFPECADMSLMAYPDFPDQSDNEWSKVRRDQGYVPITGGSTQLLVKLDGSRAIVAFRGTQPSEVSDLITDVSTAPKKFGCHITGHQGVSDALDQVWGKLQMILNDNPLVKTITVTGHSLGGMLAQQATFRWFNCRVSVDYLVTFGSPPAGNKAFSASLCAIMKDRMVRITRCADWVPRTKWMWIRGYRHCNGHYYIDRVGKWWKSPKSWRQVADRMFNFSIKDRGKHHSMKEYARITKQYWNTTND